MKRTLLTKIFFALLCEKSNKSTIVVEESAQLRETFNKYFLLNSKKTNDTCISRNSEENEIFSLSTGIRENLNCT